MAGRIARPARGRSARTASALPVQPAEARRGKLVGLLGDFDGNGANDFRARNGAEFDAAALRGGAAAFQRLYRIFGHSWRIRLGRVAVRLRPGRKTATFTKRDFPARFFTIGNLTAAQRERAEARCRALGVTDPEVLEDCILDLAVTGEDAFAEAAAIEEDVAYQETAWQTVTGLENITIPPVALAPTPDGALHVAAATTPTHDFLLDGQYAVTSLGADDAQGPVTLLSPCTGCGQPCWPPGAPASACSATSIPGPQGAAAGDERTRRHALVARAGGGPAVLPSSIGAPVSYAETAGTPWTVTGDAGGGHHTLWRGVGATATPHELMGGAELLRRERARRRRWRDAVARLARVGLRGRRNGVRLASPRWTA